MNKSIFIAFGILAAMAASCSKNADVPTVSEEDAWKYDETLSVPIVFGQLNVGIQTKAAITSFDNLNCGLFAWAADSPDNMKVSAQSIFAQNYRRVLATGSGLKFVNESGEQIKVFYPANSDYNYSFYSYYTGAADVSGEYESGDDSYIKTVSFEDPYKDILWGRFSDDSLDYEPTGSLPHLSYKGTQIKGFNARFSRAAVQQETASGTPAASDYYPNINFQHVSSAFRFVAKADSDLTPAQLDALLNNLTIDSLKITNVPSDGILVIASRDVSREGKLVKNPESSSVLTLKMPVDKSVHPTSEGDDIKAEGTGENAFFLLPGNWDQTAVVTLYLTISNSIPTSVSFELMYKDSESQPSKDFVAGKCYTFTIIFKSIEEIFMKAGLSEWDNTTNTDVTVLDYE